VDDIDAILLGQDADAAADADAVSGIGVGAVPPASKRAKTARLFVLAAAWTLFVLL
jgi:hypothetical protein